MILNAFVNLNSTQTTRTKKCSNLKNKRSSCLSQLNSQNELAFWKLELASNFAAGKKFLSDPFNFERKNSAHKERFCSNSTNSMKDSRHKKPACYCIFYYLSKINKINMPGSRQLHTVLLISKTFASRRHQQHCCASAKIQARNSNESDFTIWVWNQISFSIFTYSFQKPNDLRISAATAGRFPQHILHNPCGRFANNMRKALVC